LLPDRHSMIAQKKAKFFSNYAFKGIVSLVAIIYIVLGGLSFWQIHNLNNKIIGYDDVLQTHELKTLEKDKVAKELSLLKKSIKLSQTIKSNKKINFRILAQIASSVPKRVKFDSIDYNGSDLVMIRGSAYGDQDILKLIGNLNNQKLISQASLASMSAPNSTQAGKQPMKGFTIACIVERS